MFPALNILGFLVSARGFLTRNWKLMIGLAVASAVVYGFWKYGDYIEDRAYSIIFAEQLQQELKEQQEETRRLQEIIARRDRIIANLLQQRAETDQMVDDLLGIIRDNPNEVQPASPIIIDVIEEIRTRELMGVLPPRKPDEPEEMP